MKKLSFVVFCLLLVFALPAFASAPQEAVEWRYCFKDINYTPELQLSLEGTVLRGQAFADSPSFPAPITGSMKGGSVFFTIAYRQETGVRFYEISTSTKQGMTWGVTNDTAEFYDTPHSAQLGPCTAAVTEPGAGSGAAK